MRNAKKKKIVFTGGGTGGHITPLVSLYNYLQEEGSYDFMWLGERNSLEQDTAEDMGIEFHEVAAGKIRRYFDLRNFYEPLKNLTGVFQALYYLLRYKGDIIISKGGFVSVPTCFAGWMLRKKIYIHESDTVMGLANKISARFASKVFSSFPLEGGKKYIHTGHIMNPEMLDGIKSISKEENERLMVLVIAGSQGSEKIFQNLIQILPDCRDIDFHVVLGTQDNPDIKRTLGNFGNVKTYGFISQQELAKLYVMCDIAVTRGSSLLWELYYFGIHAIIIPLKATGGDHQTKNAEYFHEKYGSDILDEDDNLHLALFRKLQNYKELRKTGLNLKGFLDGIGTIEKEIS